MNITRKKGIVGQIGSYSSSWFFSELITFLASILTRRFLGPLQMGLWSVLQVVLNYSKFTTFGVGQAALREIPFYRGQGQTDKVEEIKNTVFSFGLLTAVIVSLGLILYAFIGRNHLRPEVFTGVLFLAALVILNRVNNILIVFLRATKQFSLAGRQLMLSSLVNAVFVAVLAYRYKIYGFMLAMALSLIFNIVYVIWHDPARLRPHLNVRLIRPLIAYGAPLMILTFLGTLFITIDKIMIARFIGLKELGWYSIAMMASNVITNFSDSIGIVMMPNLTERYGQTGNIQALKGFISKAAQAFSGGMPLVIACAWFGVPYLVKIVLPDFVEGITALKCLLLGTFFLALTHPYYQFLTAVKKHMKMFPVMAGSCALAALFDFVAVKQHLGILGISVATISAIFLRFSGIYFIASRYLDSSRQMWRSYLGFILKFIFMICALMGLQKIILWPLPDFLIVGLQISLFAFIYSPMLYRLNKEYEVWSMLRQKFFIRQAPSS